ncbi:MAG: DUF2029 domain-containing protein [Planctomycetes bacterium]|nr:DUF2029 domain-containing protein [Planctomycetota bacterium]
MTARAQRLFVAIWIALAVLLVLRTGPRERGVIVDHLEFGRRLVTGAELYAPYLDDKPLHPVYPPSFGLLTAPYAACGETAARWLWGITQVIALAVILRAFAKALAAHRPELVRHSHLLLLLTVLLLSRYLLRDTHGGGGNLINLAFAVGALTAAERGRTALGAVLLGFSLATKPTMALLVPCFLLLGHARVALGSIVAFAGFVAIALWIHGRGMAPFTDWLAGSLAYGAQVDLFATPERGFPPFTWMNQSLRCAVVRFFGEVPADFARQVPGFMPGFGLAHATTAWLARGCAALVAAVTLLAAMRAKHDAARRSIAFASALAAGVLISPIAWKAHHVALLPACFLLTIAAWSGTRGARAAWFVFFVTCTAGGGDLVGDAIKEWQQSLYVAAFAALAAWAWTARVASRARIGS